MRTDEVATYITIGLLIVLAAAGLVKSLYDFVGGFL